MMRHIALGLGLCSLMVVGCDAANKVASSAKAVGEKLSDEAAKALKSDTLKPIESAMASIPEKINALAADKKPAAQEAYESLKKMVIEFKEAAPEKLSALAKTLTEKFKELKAMIGLEG